VFKPFENGTSVVIQDIEIFLPPFPFVPNYYDGSGDLIVSDVLFSDQEKEGQYWRRVFDQVSYNERRKEEKRLQKQNPEYIDEDLEEIRILEWKRRMNGVWMMNNGDPVYMPGLYYFYLAHWVMDTGYAKFRIPDLEDFLFWQYCCEDPLCLGMLKVTVRRNGKTYQATVKTAEYVIRQRFKHGGIQSKADADAKKVYTKHLIQPLKYVVDFFKPTMDEQKGAAPKKELSLSKTITKDTDQHEAFETELGSLIDYKPSDIMGYDGDKLHRFTHDEVGKTTLIDVYERHRVVRKCCTDTETGHYIGKMIATTTVEDIEKGGKEFKEYWDGSNQKKKHPQTGQTESGLYRFFVPAFRTKHFDKYGYPDEDRAKKEILAMLESYSNNPKMQTAERRMNPMTEADLFASDAEHCPFNVAVIDSTLQYISMLPDNDRERCRRFDLVWEIPDVKVKAIPNSTNGRWSISWLPPESDQNQVHDSGGSEHRFKPLNDHKFAMGCDPVSMGIEAVHGSSCAAIAVYRKADVHHEAELFSENFIADYVHDPDNPEEFYEDQIIACFFFGCEVLIEKNKFDIYNYMKRRGYLSFVMSQPENTVSITHKGEMKEGISAGTYTIDLYVTRLKSWWSLHGHRCRQERVLEDARSFTVKTRGEHDLTVACGWARLAAEKPYKPKTVNIPIGSLFSFREQQSRH
jgi:hypothetical protein